MVFQKSTDGGKTFSDGVGIGYNQDRTQDKPWINTDDKGNLHLTWTEFDKYGSDSAHHYSKIMFSMSSDAGDTWSKPIVISDEMGGCKDDDNTMEGATSAVNSKGEIFVTWAGKGNIYLDKSIDGGKSFGTDRIIAEQKGGWVLDIPHLNRSNGMPFLQVDRSGGKNHDALYFAYTSKKEDKNKVLLLKSIDNGISWKSMKGFSSELSGHQFFTNLSVDPKTGLLALGFYDAPEHLSFNYAHYHQSISRDGGISFKTKRLTPHPFVLPHKGVFFGDYSDVDIIGSKHVAIFTTYSPSAKPNESGLNVMVWSGEQGDRFVETEWNHVWRHDHLSLLIPPNAVMKFKLKAKTKNGSQIRKTDLYANASQHNWSEGKIESGDLAFVVIKYRIKQKQKGKLFAKRVKRKSVNSFRK
jgi:hypothetical protein